MSERPPRGLVARGLEGLAWLGVGVVGTWCVAQAVFPDATFLQGALQIGGDVASVPLLVLAVGAMIDGNRRLAGAAMLVTTLHLAAHASLWGPRVAPPACGPGLTVVSANLLMVHPDPGPLFAEIAAWEADVYVLQEYSPRWDDAWRASPLARSHPYGTSIVREDSFGTAIWARMPIDAELFELGGVPQSRARVALGAGVIELVNVHVLPPRTPEYFTYWRAGLDELVAHEAASPVPFVVTGDFNASPWSKFARDMHAIADDGWELFGTGPGHTWPNGVFFLPPARIDHVFVSRDLTVTDFVIGEALGSDHSPLRVQVAPRAGGRLCAP